MEAGGECGLVKMNLLFGGIVEADTVELFTSVSGADGDLQV